MKQTIIIIALSLTIIALSLALVYKRQETHSNIFMGGAPVKIVKEPVSRKNLYSEYESTPIENVCRISAFQGDTMIIGTGQNLFLYDLSNETKLKTLLHAEKRGHDNLVWNIGQMTTRTTEGTFLVDVFILPHALWTLEGDRFFLSDESPVVEMRRYDDYFPWSKYNTSFANVTNNGIIALQDLDDGRKAIWETDNKGVIQRSWDIFPIPVLHDDFSLWFLVRPDRRKAVILMEYFDKIHILDIDNETSVESITITTKSGNRSDHKLLRKNEKKVWEDLPAFYRGACVTEKYIYALYVPVQRCMDFFDGNFQAYLRVFDWYGLFLEEYILDKKVTYISVDESRGILYGITKDNTIVRYRIFDAIKGDSY